MSSNYDAEAQGANINSRFNEVLMRITALEFSVNRIELNLARLAEHLSFELPYKSNQPPDERERRG